MTGVQTCALPIWAGEAPAAKIVLSSAAAQHTLFLQPYQQNGNGGRRYARNTRCLADRYRFVIVQLGDHFVGKARHLAVVLSFRLRIGLPVPSCPSSSVFPDEKHRAQKVRSGFQLSILTFQVRHVVLLPVECWFVMVPRRLFLRKPTRTSVQRRLPVCSPSRCLRFMPMM